MRLSAAVRIAQKPLRHLRRCRLESLHRIRGDRHLSERSAERRSDGGIHSSKFRILADLLLRPDLHRHPGSARVRSSGVDMRRRRSSRTYSRKYASDRLRAV